MPPKKRAAKAQAGTQVKTDAQATEDAPSTETAEPPKDETQPDSGDLDNNNNNDSGTGDKKEADAEDHAGQSNKPTAKPKTSKKRKAAGETAEPSKGSRKSARGATRPSQQQLLNFLLSAPAEKLLRPEDEQKDVQDRGDIRTYASSVMNPFEELMCAMILSRPISHRLGLRSIRTVLNAPYNFTSARAVQQAGEESRHQAMWDARTQHKGKTADQLGMLADVVLEKFSAEDDKDGTQLKKALSDNSNDVDQALGALRDQIKGLGNTGLDIFLRRVQWLWPDAYPFIDGKTMDSCRKIGLSQDADELSKSIEQHWKNLNIGHLSGDSDAARKRRAFVVLLERVVGADLENKVDDVLAAAASN